ncbi:MAG: hypothetical protein NVSMB29_10720 [Candidatus Dormibacteria bacterium]
MTTDFACAGAKTTLVKNTLMANRTAIVIQKFRERKRFWVGGAALGVGPPEGAGGRWLGLDGVRQPAGGNRGRRESLLVNWPGTALA